MNITKNYFKLNICTEYLENNGIKSDFFYKYNDLRNEIISTILKDNLTFKSYNILNIIFKNNSFIIELEIEQFNTSIIKFNSFKNALSFCLYIDKNIKIKEDIKNKKTHNLSLYYLNNFYYLIIENTSTYDIKYSDFEFIKYSPLIHSKILESGFKLSI